MSDADAPSGGEVKMVMAVIRPDKLSDVKAALAEIGAPSFIITNVSDRGSQPAKKSQWHGKEYTVDLHQKVKIERVVADIPADDVVDAIADVVQTDEKGDGKVFTFPAENTVQVRTGKADHDAI